MEQGFCVKNNGVDQNSGVIKINGKDGNTENAQQTCLEECLKNDKATGCEVIWDQGNRGCYVHTDEVARGNQVQRHKCWIFSKCKATGNKRPTSSYTLFLYEQFYKNVQHKNS